MPRVSYTETDSADTLVRYFLTECNAQVALATLSGDEAIQYAPNGALLPYWLSGMQKQATALGSNNFSAFKQKQLSFLQSQIKMQADTQSSAGAQRRQELADLEKAQDYAEYAVASGIFQPTLAPAFGQHHPTEQEKAIEQQFKDAVCAYYNTLKGINQALTEAEPIRVENPETERAVLTQLENNLREGIQTVNAHADDGIYLTSTGRNAHKNELSLAHIRQYTNEALGRALVYESAVNLIQKSPMYPKMRAFYLTQATAERKETRKERKQVFEKYRRIVSDYTAVATDFWVEKEEQYKQAVRQQPEAEAKYRLALAQYDEAARAAHEALQAQDIAQTALVATQVKESAALVEQYRQEKEACSAEIENYYQLAGAYQTFRTAIEQYTQAEKAYKRIITPSEEAVSKLLQAGDYFIGVGEVIGLSTDKSERDNYGKLRADYFLISRKLRTTVQKSDHYALARATFFSDNPDIIAYGKQTGLVADIQPNFADFSLPQTSADYQNLMQAEDALRRLSQAQAKYATLVQLYNHFIQAEPIYATEHPQQEPFTLQALTSLSDNKQQDVVSAVGSISDAFIQPATTAKFWFNMSDYATIGGVGALLCKAFPRYMYVAGLGGIGVSAGAKFFGAEKPVSEYIESSALNKKTNDFINTVWNDFFEKVTPQKLEHITRIQNNLYAQAKDRLPTQQDLRNALEFALNSPCSDETKATLSLVRDIWENPETVDPKLLEACQDGCCFYHAINYLEAKKQKSINESGMLSPDQVLEERLAEHLSEYTPEQQRLFRNFSDSLTKVKAVQTETLCREALMAYQTKYDEKLLALNDVRSLQPTTIQSQQSAQSQETTQAQETAQSRETTQAQSSSGDKPLTASRLGSKTLRQHAQMYAERESNDSLFPHTAVHIKE